MGYRVIETDDKVWVAGINWLTFATRPPAKDLIELAKESKSGLVAMRNAGAFQVGFCQLEKLPKVKKKQVLCLGPAVSMSRAVPWRGIFDLGDGQWWYVAVRDNFMLTIDGDVVGDRDLVDSIAQSHAFYGDWDEFEGTLADALEFASMQDAPHVSLTRANAGPARTIGILAVAAMGLSAAAYAGFLFSQHMRLVEIEKKAEEAKARQLAQAKLRTEVQARQSVSLAVDPQHFLRVCADKMLSIPSVDRGWELLSMECTPGSLQLRWRQHTGADPAFGKSAGGGVFDKASKTLTITEGLANTTNIVLQDDPARAKAQKKILDRRLENLGMVSQGSGDSYTLPLPGQASPEGKPSEAAPVVKNPASSTHKPEIPPVPSAPGQAIAISLNGMVPPSVAQSLFAGISGLTLAEVHWSEHDGWRYTGEIR